MRGTNGTNETSKKVSRCPPPSFLSSPCPLTLIPSLTLIHPVSSFPHCCFHPGVLARNEAMETRWLGWRTKFVSKHLTAGTTLQHITPLFRLHLMPTFISIIYLYIYYLSIPTTTITHSNTQPSPLTHSHLSTVSLTHLSSVSQPFFNRSGGADSHRCPSLARHGHKIRRTATSGSSHANPHRFVVLLLFLTPYPS